MGLFGNRGKKESNIFDENGNIADLEEYEGYLKRQEKGTLEKSLFEHSKNRVPLRFTEKDRERAVKTLKLKVDSRAVYKLLAKILVEDDVVGFVISDSVNKVRIDTIEAMVMCENKKLPDLCISRDENKKNILKGRGGCRIQDLPFEMVNSVSYKTDGTYDFEL